jgi:hypothetical protein
LSLWLDNGPIDLVFDIDQAAGDAVETYDLSTL